ncbi:HNH endonuclease [Enterococcus faecalis]|uniref:HNH endonuclease n=1 Tax=Enterococcus faecalis TaxID=1351 RepID=UPI000459905E|nr:HNH endonuclease signature motif containing protein [Enterococcus faecalis]KAJ84727.1 hypothetical protein P791_1675 [Enterococcus faecalis NY9]
MFDKREIPSLTIESVINSIKESYTTSKGFSSKLTDKFIEKMIIYEKEYIYLNTKFHLLSPVDKVDEVTNDIAVYFYDNKIAKEKIGKIYNALLKNNNAICPVCGAHADTLDHVLPKTIYTQYCITPINLVPLCSRCNRKKGTIIYKQKKGEVIFHPYFNDYHELEGLKIDYLINKQRNIIPTYYFEQTANKKYIYNFQIVFKLDVVLSALAVDEMTKLSRVILTKVRDTRNLKYKAKKLIQQKRKGLIKNLDEPWKILLYEFLDNKFDIYYNYEIIERLNNS